MEAVVGAGIRSIGRAVAGDVVLLGGEAGAPLGAGEDEAREAAGAYGLPGIGEFHDVHIAGFFAGLAAAGGDGDETGEGGSGDPEDAAAFDPTHLTVPSINVVYSLPAEL